MAKPVLITQRSIIQGFLVAWRRLFQQNGGSWIGTRTGSAYAVCDKVCALNLDTCTAEEIDAIVGNTSWTKLSACDGCDERDGGPLVRVGQESDSDSHTARLCRACVTKAFEAISEGEGTDQQAAILRLTESVEELRRLSTEGCKTSYPWSDERERAYAGRLEHAPPCGSCGATEHRMPYFASKTVRWACFDGRACLDRQKGGKTAEPESAPDLGGDHIGTRTEEFAVGDRVIDIDKGVYETGLGTIDEIGKPNEDGDGNTYADVWWDPMPESIRRFMNGRPLSALRHVVQESPLVIRPLAPKPDPNFRLGRKTNRTLYMIQLAPGEIGDEALVGMLDEVQGGLIVELLNEASEARHEANKVEWAKVRKRTEEIEKALHEMKVRDAMGHGEP